MSKIELEKFVLFFSIHEFNIFHFTYLVNLNGNLMSISKPTLEVENVSKCYGSGKTKIQALSNFSLSCNAGEIVGMLGPNGAGKTTVVKAIVKLITTDSGTVKINGQPTNNGRHLRDVSVMLEGKGAIKERLSIYENAKYYCALREKEFSKEHFDELVSILNITSTHEPVRKKSTGNKLRCALLTAMIHRPKIIVLDEPTIGLDFMGEESLTTLIRTAVSNGATILLSTHSLDFIEENASRIVCINGGKKLFDGSKQQFCFRDYSHKLTLRGIPYEKAKVILKDIGRYNYIDENSLSIEFQNHEKVINFISNNVKILKHTTDMELKKFSLKDKYKDLMRKKGSLPESSSYVD